MTPVGSPGSSSQGVMVASHFIPILVQSPNKKKFNESEQDRTLAIRILPPRQKWWNIKGKRLSILITSSNTGMKTVRKCMFSHQTNITMRKIMSK